MSSELYHETVEDVLADLEPVTEGVDELRNDDRRVTSALHELEDDFARSGAELKREELDRAAARHLLSITEVAALASRADAAGLLEGAGRSLTRLDRPQQNRSASGASLDLLQVYISDIRRFPLLEATDEVTLARTIEAGRRASDALKGDDVPEAQVDDLKLLVERGEAARQRFVLSNLRLAFNQAKFRRNQGLDLLDLLQEGTIGIIRAVDKFDYQLGYKFSTYATWWIKQAMDRALADKGRLIRLPVHVVEKIRKIRSSERRLDRELGREPTILEVAAKTGFDPADIAFLRDISQEIRSLDAPLRDRDGDPLRLLDLVRDPDADVEGTALNHIESDNLKLLLEMLDETQRHVLELRYGIGMNPPHTLQEIGTSMGITRERVRQIETKAKKSLVIAARSTGLFTMDFD
jgi:RNA polymerase sigma factor (sigma-70 family)